jgi:predicted metal-dependent hydrolase
MIAGSVTLPLYGHGMTDFPIDVIRSERRKRTVQAYLRDGRIRVMVPAGLEIDEERRLVEQLAARVGRKATSATVDLAERARQLAARYRLPVPAEIIWSERQMKRWGSCSPGEGRIRISSRLASMPRWVLDSVIIHELAHLEVSGHGPAFAALIDRYELTERAKGYLMAVSEGMTV